MMPDRFRLRPRMGLGSQRARIGIAARMTRTFVLIAGTLILLIGLVLAWASYAAVLEQVQVRQQKTAREAALVTTAYLTRARDTLNTYGQLGSLQGLLLRSMRVQQEELSQLMIEHGGMFRGLTLVDSNGNELAKVLASSPAGEGASSASDTPPTIALVPVTDLGSVVDSAAFRRAIDGETYVSGDVTGRQGDVAPAVTIAVPLRGRDRDGVLIADVSIDGLWDEMRAVDMGSSGYAYIVSRNAGELITAQRDTIPGAHSVSVPGGDDVQAAEWSTSEIELIEQLIAGEAGDGAPSPDLLGSTEAFTSAAARYVGLTGEEVVGAGAVLPGTDWILLVELPVNEAMAGANRLLYLLALLVVVGALGAGSVGLLVPRRVVRPILALQAGAKEIAEGRLSHSIEIKTGDELQDLADTFNQMASGLEASRHELEKWGRELEVRVSERTLELADVTDQMRRRADQLQISAEVAHAIASVRDLDTLLPHVTRLISERFGWYHVGIFLLEEALHPGAAIKGLALSGRRGEYAILRAANSDGGQRMLAAGHKLRVAHVGESDPEQLLGKDDPGKSGAPFGIVGSVAGTGRPRIALDVGADAVYFDNPELPGTRSEMALPLKVGDRVIGVLDVQSTRAQAYDDQDVALLGVLADQVAVAIENALLFEQTQEALEEVRTLHRRYVEQEWVRSTTAQGELAYEYRRGAGAPVAVDDSRPELHTVLPENCAVDHSAFAGRASDKPDDRPGDPQKQDTVSSALAVPIKFRDQVIGMVDLQDTDEPRWWTDDEIVLVQAIADQVGLALENARLFADTQQRAEQLATLHRVGLDVTAALDLDGVLLALYQQISHIIDARLFYVAFYDEPAGVIDFPLVMGDEGRVEAPARRMDQEPGIAGEVLETGSPLYVPDLLHRDGSLDTKQLDRAASAGGRRMRSYVGVPLLFRDHVFGVLSVQSDRPNAYSQEDVDLMATIATQASIAIQNARAYQQLVQTAEQLREIDRLKTQFLANMSHELRTPLNSIIGFSRVMLKGIDGPLTDLQESDLNSIYGSGQHLLGLINSILDMSKIEAGKMDLSFDEVSLHEVFNTVISTTRALVKDQPIELRTEIPDSLPPVWADSQRVRQVLLNLVSNASKFTEEGYIKLQAEVGTGEGAGFVTISVEDTGIGIDEDAQGRLFIPFQQVDASTTRRAGGTGLGLAISRSFVEMQGGKIWVESAPGQGTTFFFTLPVYVPQVPARAPEVSAQPEGREGGAFAAPGVATDADSARLEPASDARPVSPAPNVILVVDDDGGVVTLFKRYLEREGYRVVGLAESSQTVDVVRRLAPQIAAITLDIVMPRMDGWQVLSALKNDAGTRDVPVILCSILDGIEHGIALGADGWLHKPVTRDEILAAVRKVQAARASQRSAADVEPAATSGTGPSATFNVSTAPSEGRVLPRNQG